VLIGRILQIETSHGVLITELPIFTPWLPNLPQLLEYHEGFSSSNCRPISVRQASPTRKRLMGPFASWFRVFVSALTTYLEALRSERSESQMASVNNDGWSHYDGTASCRSTARMHWHRSEENVDLWPQLGHTFFRRCFRTEGVTARPSCSGWRRNSQSERSRVLESGRSQ